MKVVCNSSGEPHGTNYASCSMWRWTQNLKLKSFMIHCLLFQATYSIFCTWLSNMKYHDYNYDCCVASLSPRMWIKKLWMHRIARGDQRRLDGSVDFYREWKAYKEGFGSLSGEFWLGNDNLHRLTYANDVMLRVDLEDFEENITYAEHKTFKVADEVDNCRLTLGEYSGTSGDSFTPQRYYK